MKTNEKFALDELLERKFNEKRNAFLEDYDLKEKPALILQAHPTTDASIDILNKSIQNAMFTRNLNRSADTWWEGFTPNGAPYFVFDGLSSTSHRSNCGWATEFHVDGHLTAGIWTFSLHRTQNHDQEACIAAFYKAAFSDFTSLAERIFEATGVVEGVYITATLHLAKNLAFVGNSGQLLAPAPKRKTLRWPITSTSTKDLSSSGIAMATQFFRAYGYKMS